MTYNFLKDEEKIKSGTIFSLGGDIWGYDITLFNYFGEEEILLEPERKYKVDNVLPSLNEIIYVNCKILTTPLVLDSNINDNNQINNNIDIHNNNGNKKLQENIINNKEKNYIISEINIDKNKINKKIRLINSFDPTIKEKRGYIHDIEEEDYYKYENEKEIKDNCEIEINGEKIKFSYFYEFKKEGKYIIKYIFLKNLTKTDFMFYDCDSLTNLNLSNFNTQNVTNMSYMFYFCKSLANINLSNFNTQNVTNMSHMFYYCKSLTNINLSNFNTQNVKSMREMFYGCNSLINLNLSNFNTQNVTNMSYMFYFCESLTNLNLSSFNTQNVTDMSEMFCDCKSITNLNLSNFNTQNATN